MDIVYKILDFPGVKWAFLIVGLVIVLLVLQRQQPTPGVQA